MNEKRIAIIIMVALGSYLLLMDRGTMPCKDTGYNPVEMTALTNMLLRENNLMKEHK
jgi:hypothetical protein